MKVYIAYKYTNVEDKESMRGTLEKVSGIITDLGHTTFLLGRDKKNWSSSRFPLWKTIPNICLNLLKADVLFAYIEGEEKSKGLTFELTFAKLFRKRIIIAFTNSEDTCKFERRTADKIIQISELGELRDLLAREL